MYTNFTLSVGLNSILKFCSASNKLKNKVTHQCILQLLQVNSLQYSLEIAINGFVVDVKGTTIS